MAMPIFLGLLAGAFLGVSCVEVAFYGASGLLLWGLLALVGRFSCIRREKQGLSRWLVVIPVALGLAGLAALAPLKQMDRPIPKLLPSEALTVAELGRFLDVWPEVAPEAAARVVHLPSRRPTWREVDAALTRDSGLRLRFGYCGFGASLLFGPHPIGPPRIAARE